MLYLLDGLTFRITLFHSIFYFFLTWGLVLVVRCLAIDPSFDAVFCKMFWCFRAFFSKLLTPIRKLNQKDKISKGSSLAKNKSFSISFFCESQRSKNESTNPLMFTFYLIEKVVYLLTYYLFTCFIYFTRYAYKVTFTFISQYWTQLAKCPCMNESILNHFILSIINPKSRSFYLGWSVVCVQKDVPFRAKDVRNKGDLLP